MRRWHAEQALMFKRWRVEMATHGYDWRNPPDPKCDRDACHCAAGIGSMRKRRPYDCGNTQCGVCHFEKFHVPKARDNKRRAAIQYELDAGLVMSRLGWPAKWWGSAPPVPGDCA